MAALASPCNRLLRAEDAHPHCGASPLHCRQPHPGHRLSLGYNGGLNIDARNEVRFPGAAGLRGLDFQCRDATTGALKWCVQTRSDRPTRRAVADINGYGRDERVFSDGNTIYAAGGAQSHPVLEGAVLWKPNLPTGPVRSPSMTRRAAATPRSLSDALTDTFMVSGRIVSKVDLARRHGGRSSARL